MLATGTVPWAFLLDKIWFRYGSASCRISCLIMGVNGWHRPYSWILLGMYCLIWKYCTHFQKFPLSRTSIQHHIPSLLSLYALILAHKQQPQLPLLAWGSSWLHPSYYSIFDSDAITNHHASQDTDHSRELYSSSVIHNLNVSNDSNRTTCRSSRRT